MIARWNFQARFGYKQDAINLIKQWNEEIGSQTDIDMSSVRMITGSVGASEALVQLEFPIDGLSDLDGFFGKISEVKMHADWGKRMSEVVVSGSTHWQVFREI